MVKTRLRFLSLFLVILLTSCNSGVKESTKASDAATSAAPISKAQPAENVDFERQFDGAINSKYQIAMVIRRKGEKLEGSYFYKRVGKNLQLKGTVQEDGSFELAEFDSGGNSTGFFKGNSITAKRLEGTWSKPNGAKAMPFYVEATEGNSGIRNPVATSDFRKALVKQLVRDGDIDSSCAKNPAAEVIGVKAIDLNQEGQPEYLVEGQSCACGGADSNCLNWVYRNNNGSYEQILGNELSQGGTALDALKTRTNGYLDLGAVAIGANRVVSITYKFDGQRYRSAKCEECNSDGERCHSIQC